MLTPEQQAVFAEGIQAQIVERVAENPLPSWALDLVHMNDDESNAMDTVTQYPIPLVDVSLKETSGIGESNLTTIDFARLSVDNKTFTGGVIAPAAYLRSGNSGALETVISRTMGGLKNFWWDQVKPVLFGASGKLCYDGQELFSSNHAHGKLTGQDNDISVDISAVTAQLHGSVTDPSVEELVAAVSAGVNCLRTLKTGVNTYPNENVQSFFAIFPAGFNAAKKAFDADSLQALVATLLASNAGSGIGFDTGKPITIKYTCLPSYTDTDSFVLFPLGGSFKPALLQRGFSQTSFLGTDSELCRMKQLVAWPHVVTCGTAPLDWLAAVRVTLI